MLRRVIIKLSAATSFHVFFQVYDYALEDIPEFNGFTDFCDTFQIMAGDGMDDDDEGQEVIGEFKGAFKVYELPEDPNEELPPRHMDRLPSPAPEECVVRVYLVQAYDLQPADPNGMVSKPIELFTVTTNHCTSTLLNIGSSLPALYFSLLNLSTIQPQTR